MRKLTVTICLTLTILLGSVGMSASADFQKGAAAAQRGDLATALREWKLLAEQGNASAQFNLGVLYRDGQGVPKNEETAVKWFRLAAEQGNANAQYSLGLMYGTGQGVIQDWVYAHMWGNLGASNGSESGGELRDLAAKEMTPAEISKAQDLASECARKKYTGC